MENYDLKFLKKYYGEKFSHLCRTLFPTLLEQEGLLTQIISDNFAPTKMLYEDIANDSEKKNLFTLFVLSKSKMREKKLVESDETPEKLFDLIGYTLFPECQTNDEILAFRKYYASDEELCTFREKRLKTHRVFFAVRKDVDQIKRKDFPNPKREDRYGTSVLSIQFSKTSPDVSIKSRYNHAVYNPDATFGNDLDFLIEGLTSAFKKKYDINIDMEKMDRVSFPNYVKADDGKLYRYNIVNTNGDYFCENGKVVTKGGKTVKYNKDKFILMDDYLLDKEKKTVGRIVGENLVQDGFTYSIGPIQEIVENVDELKNRVITIKPKQGKDIKIVIDRVGSIIEYENSNAEIIQNEFLENNQKLRKISLPNVTMIGHNFLVNNIDLSQLNVPNINVVGDCFLSNNKGLKELTQEKLIQVGCDFLRGNYEISKLYLPQISIIGNSFMLFNRELEEIDLPKCTIIGNSFFFFIDKIKRVKLDRVVEIGSSFMFDNTKLEEVVLNNVKGIDDAFLDMASGVTRVEMQNIESIGHNFMQHNTCCREIVMPKIKEIGNGFFIENSEIREISFPQLEKVGDRFMLANLALKKIDMPKVEEIGDFFFDYYKKIDSISLPFVKKIGDCFMSKNISLREINLENVEEIGRHFLYDNEELREIIADKLFKVGDNFMRNNRKLQKVSMHNVRNIEYSFLKNAANLDYIDIESVSYIGEDCLVYGARKQNVLTLPCAGMIRKGFARKSDLQKLIVPQYCDVREIQNDVNYEIEFTENTTEKE